MYWGYIGIIVYILGLYRDYRVYVGVIEIRGNIRIMEEKWKAL